MTIFRACILSLLLAGIASAQVVTGGGGGGGASAGQFSVKTYGAVGTAKHDNAITVTSGQPTISAADSPWIATDVGSLIFCVFNASGTNGFVAGTKITAFTDANHVTLNNNPTGGTASYECTWSPQDDTAAFQAAFTAAAAATTSVDPNFGGTVLSYPATIYVPPGGYMVSGAIYTFNGAGGSSLPPAFVGAGPNQVIIYPRSDTFTAGSVGCLMGANNTAGLIWSGFYVYGSQFAFSCTGGVPFLRINSSSHAIVRDVKITNVGITQANTSNLNIFGSSTSIKVDHVYIQAAGAGSNTGHALFRCDNSSGVDIVNSFFSNGVVNAIFTNCGTRGPSGGQVSVIGGMIDETASNNFNGASTVVQNTSTINFFGTTIFSEPTTSGFGALQVDGTSQVYLSSASVGPFNTVSNSNGIGCAAGAFIYSTGSHIKGGGTTGLIVTGPGSGTCTFVDEGGNTEQTCNNTTCTNVTPATFAAEFTPNVTYKSSLTHTPNTCYAVTGNLLATAQNLCTILLDQNYQVLTITAQSGGTTPTNSTCATPPVITLSDGTRSATMTMTSGKTQWNSGVDAVTNLNQVFASGATLTVSIGANTCATPPSNVSVNYDLQSVINP